MTEYMLSPRCGSENKMFEIGKYQKLYIKEINASGALLVRKDAPAVTLLLPGKQIPAEAHAGSALEVFVYRDSEDRLIATTKTPAITLGELKMLTVAEVTEIGAFLSWGLDKDLFLPFSEQKGKLSPGKKVLAGLYVDKSGRLCASMRISRFLSEESPYKPGDKVSGTVYSVAEDIGAFVAVDGKYYGLIPTQELYTRLKVGDEVKARVLKVRPDGKLNLSTRKKAYAQMRDDAETLLSVIDSFGGELPFGEEASPEKIKEELGLSKAAFKRAVGQLLKQRKIEKTGTGIRRI